MIKINNTANHLASKFRISALFRAWILPLHKQLYQRITIDLVGGL